VDLLVQYLIGCLPSTEIPETAAFDHQFDSTLTLSQRTLYTLKFIAPRDYFWPIHQNDLVVNPKLVQNPGLCRFQWALPYLLRNYRKRKASRKPIL